MISRPRVGVDGADKAIMFNALLFNFLSSVLIFTVFSSWAQTRAPYESIALTMPSYAHLINFGFGPWAPVTSELIADKSFFALVTLDSTWIFQVSFASKVTPRYTTDFEYFSFCPSNVSATLGLVFFLVKRTATVFQG